MLQLLLLAIVCCFSGSGAWAQVELVREGKARAVVVTPDQPLRVETYAAEELVAHVRLAGGCALPVRKESEDRPDGAPRVYIGACEATKRACPVDWANRPPNASLLRAQGNVLYLAGRDGGNAPLLDDTSAGTLFAVYEVLERFLQVRWLWPGELGTFVPRRATLAIPATDLQFAPPLAHTRVRFGGLMISPTGWSSPEARDRFAQENLQWLRRHRFARGISLEYGHGFEAYHKRFGETHPEYFNRLPDGTRRSDPTYYGGEDRLIAMCVSEPGLWRERVREWQETRTPQKPWVNCAENDTCGKCTCERCRALDVAGTIDGDPKLSPAEGLKRAEKAFAAGEPDWWRWLGSLSDRYAHFWLGVQAEARKVDPDATVLAYAYANYHKPPAKTRLNDHIVVAIVPALMYPWTPEKRRAFREQWSGWAGAGARLYLRPNYTLDGHAFPIFYAHRLADDFNFAAKHGLIATDFDSLTSEFGAQGPNHYVLARLHQHPEWPAEKLLGEYYAGFGPAEKQVRAYFQHWRKVSDGVTEEFLKKTALQRTPEGGSWGRFYLIADLIFPPRVMADGRALLERAAAAAQGDPLAERRVAFLEKGLRHAELCLATEKARQVYTQSGSLPEYQAALQALDDLRRSMEGENAVNAGFLRYLEGPVWDRALLTALKQPGERLPGPWKFQFDPEGQGAAKGWSRPECDDGAWPAIGISSAWEQQPVGKEWEARNGRGYNGLAWYRTTFRLKPAAKGERVSLVFGAVDESCVIWVNGRQVLQRTYDAAKNPNSWMEAFEVEVTPHVRYDAPNSLVVRVEDNSGAGGIWRPVWVVQSEPVAEGARNLLPDGGFEANPTPWKSHAASGEFRFVVDTEGAHGGKASGRIEGVKPAEREPAPGAGKAWGRWYQIGIPLQEGRKYRLRAWVRTAPEFAGTSDIWVRTAPGGDGAGNKSVRVPATKGLWQQVELDDIVAGANAGALYLNLMKDAGSVWFDDVEITAR